MPPIREQSEADDDVGEPVPVGEPDVELVLAEVGCVLREDRGVVMETLAHEDPAHVRPERALTRRVRIAFLIRLLMMDAMRRDPEDRSAFERERAADREEVLDELGGLVAAVREQPVIRHADAEHAAGVVENQRGEHRAVVDDRRARLQLRYESRSSRWP